MLQIIAHTPGWVFGLLVLLIGIGAMQARARTIGKARALALPLLMLCLSLAGVLSNFGLGLLPMAFWALGVIATLWLMDKRPADNIHFDASTNRFSLPGSWVPMLVIMAMFITKYLVAVQMALHAPVVKTPLFVACLSALYGSFSGFFAARARSLWRMARTASSIG